MASLRMTASRVKGQDLFRHLALNRHLVEIAETRFAALTEGLDHPRIDTARSRLRVTREQLAHAAGGLSGWARTWLGMVEFGVAAFVAATIAGQAIGLSAGWTVTLTIIVVLALAWPVNAFHNALAKRINRRRIKSPEPPVRILPAAEPEPVAEIIEILLAVRDKLATVMNQLCAAHRFGHLARTAAGFDWLRQHDQALYRVSVADRSVCEAIDSIEIWHRASESGR